MSGSLNTNCAGPRNALNLLIMTIFDLIVKEGWKPYKDIDKKGKISYLVKTPYEDDIGPLKAKHPAFLHLDIYAKHTLPSVRYQHLKKARFQFWPNRIWHDWTRRRYEAHCEGYNYITQAGGGSKGKAQPLTAKIRTPFGYTTMGELKVGLVLCDTEGNLQTVKAIHPQGIQDIYEINFSDGSKTEATGDHLWKVRNDKDRDKHREGKVLTTLEIQKNISKHYSIPKHEALSGIDTFPLPLDPWLLGYYIGNGNFSTLKGSPRISCPTETLVNKIKSKWSNISVSKRGNCYTVGLKGLRSIFINIPELAFKKSTSKSIPACYLYGSLNTRRQLLQGLIESDGTKPPTVDSGTSIAFSNKLLRDQTAELARSLGYFVSTALPKKTHYTKNGVKYPAQDSYKLFINKKNRHRVITSIKFLRKDYAQCITVSNPNSLYLTDNLIVTHNSADWGEIAVLFYFSNPLENNVTIASTTLASLKGRIWGYVTDLIRTMEIQPQYKYTSSPSPQILPIVPAAQLKKTGRGAIEDDTLHGMFAVSAKPGDDFKTISTWIGKHPKNKMLIILDECTEMPIAITDAFPNLNSHAEKFQLAGIGNSRSWQDLHGLLSHPENGIDSVSIELEEWKTKMPNGICQYFNPYKCPAITDPDPERRKLLSKFLISEENLKKKEIEVGIDSEGFYRFVLGFWKNQATDDTTVSGKFLKDFSPRKKVQWSGYYPIQRVAGFDFAISSDGDNPLLRIANVGHDVDGTVKIDFAGESSIFKLQLLAIADKSYEFQIAEQIIDILQRYGVQMNNFGIDITGQGRAIGEVIRLRNEQRGYPIGIGFPLKIYSMSQHNKNKRKESALDIMPMSTHELWNDVRTYIEADSIRGLDEKTIQQLTNRLIIRKNDKSMLESKKDYKKRMSAIGNAHSPDEADASAIALQVVKQRLGIMPGTKWKTPNTEQASSYLDKVHAMSLQQNKVQIKPPVQMPKVSFGGGLEKYAKYKRNGV